MEKATLLDKLDRATDRCAHLAISKCMPIRISKTSTMIGNTFVEKNNDGSYSITALNKIPVYINISIFDIAVIIAQRYNAGESNTIARVLALESRFSKYHNDMLHYLNCLKVAKKRHDTQRMAILEDKFQVAELSARGIRDNISIFKKMR